MKVIIITKMFTSTVIFQFNIEITLVKFLLFSTLKI
ncbi:hypothetical protein EDC54_101610 [Samsonia erythrinae]|uniref:Uncharacterized protein n=1 Tax=Samsonia erythrinae TaxID=160434 RepID=A0A4R3VUI9_9GAMM|nr:hypothetical protein EDC54_101610 [Samsonia erythrinae]